MVSVFELRKRGYPVEYKIPETDEEIKNIDKLSNFPNLAYIDPKTGKNPKFSEIKVKSSDELISELKSTIKPGERYFFIYYSKYFRRNENNTETARHIIEVMKDKNGRLLFVDPQANVKLPEEFALNVTLDYKKFEEKMYPKIMRVDDKDLNYEVMNKITQPEGTYQKKIKHKK